MGPLYDAVLWGGWIVAALLLILIVVDKKDKRS